MMDRLLLALVRWRLHRDAGHGFMGHLVHCLAQRMHQIGDAVDAQKAVERSIAQLTIRTMALQHFSKLEAGEVVRQ